MRKRRACHFGADVSFEPDFIGREVKAWRAVDAIAVEQRHGRHVVVGTHANQFLGQGRAFEKAECGAGVEFDKQVLSTQYSVLSF
jgi:hypothetical protein